MEPIMCRFDKIEDKPQKEAGNIGALTIELLKSFYKLFISWRR